MPIHPADLFQRLRHWQGQALRSHDLNDQLAFDALMRAWHNRALHTSYGISEGLRVCLDASGERVEVSPGLAYDPCGCPLVLSRPAHFYVPDEIPDRGLVLVLGTVPGEAGRMATDLGGTCLPGLAYQSVSVRLSWVPARLLDPRQGVALALLLPGPELEMDWNQSQSRPLARPRMANGATLPGNTDWRLWELDREGREITPQPSGVAAREEGHGEELRILVPEAAEIPTRTRSVISALGLQVDIDTSAAGFTAAPCYMAWLEGDVWQPDLVDRFVQDRGSLVPESQKNLLRLVDGLLLLELLGMRLGHVHRPTAAGFTYRLWFPQIAKWIHTRSLLAYLLLLAQEGHLAVAWVGVQDA